jgi:glucose-6-phosphate 1-dehydrogenase
MPDPVATINPLAEGLHREQTAEPTAVVIFGATGDLTERKLLPALYALAREMFLPARFAVVGSSRREMTDEAFRRYAHEAVTRFGRIKPEPRSWEAFAEGLSYVAGSFDDPATFEKLNGHLKRLDSERGTAGNRVFYMAVPPSVFPPLLRQLGDAKLVQRVPSPFTRVVIEKPFGHDLNSARKLNAEVQETLLEDQIYRMDHYLGKETVQNLFVFRFANSLFEPLWNHNYVDHVQITVAENLGMEGRGRFFEEAGIVRDIIQNHVLQVLSLVGMEPPGNFRANEVRDEKVKLLRAVHLMTPDEVAGKTVRAQYDAGLAGGREVPGYREEEGVVPNSQIETYAALRLEIDNWRWAGVPFYLRAGKRLAKKVTEVAVVFRPVPHLPFAEGNIRATNNALLLRIQPDEGISLRFEAKVPGQRVELQPVKMDFLYGTSFGVAPPEAYERLLLDCILGDATLFARADEVEAAWSIVNPLLDAWSSHDPPPLARYAAGSWGPEEADRLAATDGNRWRRL